jgi:hypothetical protein
LFRPDFSLYWGLSVDPVSLTAGILFAAIVGLCAYDFYAFRKFGNSATFSWILLGIEARLTFFGPLVGYALSVLIAHLFLPEIQASPPTWIVLCRMAIVLSPVIGGFGIIAWHPAGSSAMFAVLARNRFKQAAVILVAMILGLLVGMFAVPQHEG